MIIKKVYVFQWHKDSTDTKKFENTSDFLFETVALIDLDFFYFLHDSLKVCTFLLYPHNLYEA